jgi:hypothetical protein
MQLPCDVPATDEICYLLLVLTSYPDAMLAMTFAFFILANILKIALFDRRVSSYLNCAYHGETKTLFKR